MPQSSKGCYRILFLVLASAAVLGIAPFLGIESFRLSQIVHNETVQFIFFGIRLPRVLSAFCAGGGLALCGMVYQAIFRNPLTDPFTLGISSGASLGAALAIFLGLGSAVLGLTVVSLGAFLGAGVAMAMVFLFSRLRGNDSLAILLAGVVVSMIFSSLLMFIYYLSETRHSFMIIHWLMGGLEGVSLRMLAVFVPIFAIGIALIAAHLPELDHFLTGEDLAQTRGIHVPRSRTILLIATSLVTGAIVALCGPIGFVGIMAPHLCRMFLSGRHRILALASFLVGGTFLVLADVLSRTLAAPAEIPIGIITSLTGGPFFLWLLMRRKGRMYF